VSRLTFDPVKESNLKKEYSFTSHVLLYDIGVGFGPFQKL
jgi:hypothetical protein